MIESSNPRSMLALVSAAAPPERVAGFRTAADYLAAAVANNTRRAYQSDLHEFIAWAGSLPSSPQVVADYLAAHADAHAVATLCRRLVAIGRAHTALSHPNPCQTELVGAVLRGIRRIHGRAQRQVRPVLRDELVSMLPHMRGTRGVRDRALMLLGFAAALRRSELVALDHRDIAFVKEGLTILIRNSKTDQFGEGRKIAIPYARSVACPVEALRSWLTLSGIGSGPLFRAVNKGGAIGANVLSAQTVALRVKEYAEKAGLDPNGFSGHSLRAGLATSAAKAGVGSWAIRKQTGHRSEAMLQRYIRDAELFTTNAAGSVL